MTAGGESTEVQLTTGGKAVSSNHCPGSRAESGFNQSGARSELQLQPAYGTLIAQRSPCVPSHPLDVSLAVQKFQAPAVSPHRGVCLHCPNRPATYEGLFFPFTFLGLLQQGALWVPIYPFHFVPMRWHSDIIWKISNSPALLDQRKGRWLQCLRNHLRGFITWPPLPSTAHVKGRLRAHHELSFFNIFCAECSRTQTVRGRGLKNGLLSWSPDGTDEKLGKWSAV